MRRHVIAAVAVWVVLTAIGETLALADLYPTVGSSEAEDFDRIFRILIVMGMPVFTFVIAVLFYCVIRFGSFGKPSEDGPAYRGAGLGPRVWLAVTGSLALTVMIFPGLTGLAELQPDKSGYGWGESNAELVVRVVGFRWSWTMEYADAGVTVSTAQGKELVLPVDTHVKFEIESTDVIHSFWIPAFRMKIDALPGRTTHMTVKTTALGRFEDDDAYRVQCAELCGLDHSTMTFPVRVVPRAEFEQWLQSQKPAATAQ
ncbi:MAG: cytochrome c oxidase subunit II [Dehalococcoidia bacterium]|nr:cytochrome c oxidase subunit II [Dehalococcoidia bacterium]MCL4230840.1 cytochrome c oxidase subunit II [Dehalococcoidia bacterium]NUQ54974.1 cytochrome c oxidase subunit II [Dehalococcoidia bacterium]